MTIAACGFAEFLLEGENLAEPQAFLLGPISTVVKIDPKRADFTR
jgi:hypothetical protein